MAKDSPRLPSIYLVRRRNGDGTGTGGRGIRCHGALVGLCGDVLQEAHPWDRRLCPPPGICERQS